MRLAYKKLSLNECNPAYLCKGSVAFRPYLTISLAFSSLIHARLDKHDTSFEVAW